MVLSVKDRLNLAECVDLIAERVRKPGEPLRTTKNKARGRILYNANRGVLLRQSDGCFLRGDLIEWARRVYPGKFMDQPAFASGSGTASGSCSVTAGAIALPRNYDEACAELSKCQRKLAAVMAELAEVRPDALKWRAWIARKGRKRPDFSG